MRYSLPDNVVHLEVHYLHEPQSKPPVIKRKGNAQVFKEIRCLHDQYRHADSPKTETASLLASIMKHRNEGRYAEADFLYSRESWDYITEQYRALYWPFVCRLFLDGAYHALAVVEADGVNRKFYSCESFSYISRVMQAFWAH